MGVAALLDLDDDRAGLLKLAEDRWCVWVDTEPRLGVVPGGMRGLRPWLRVADSAAADEALLGLAMLAAPDGGDDVAAAAVLAWALLPGACHLAHRLTVGPRRAVGGADTSVDELVAAQLWLEVRSFAWRRRRKVAANLLMDTRAGVLLELGDYHQVARVDRSWAHTTLADVNEENRSATELPAAEEEPLEVLLELLEWATTSQVISEDDRCLLMCLVDEAARSDVQRSSRGRGGFASNDLSRAVAPRVGVSEATVRRRAARSMRALSEAVAGGGFRNEG
ncbi:hypothetical protein [Nocardioides sp. InS609-2]|uniref:hypothetical protein n=1 Tax=Nocardioides sp. InS609-2 TaxID=2760705 RepID=UPI0020BD8405|nr:hypothetical protein [Nocardioides sp. InS609-2]